MEEQKRLFEILKTKIPGSLKLADILEELLKLGSDAVYRRIRGETELTFSELHKICTEFKLSMDDVLNNSYNQGAVFHHVPADINSRETHTEYFKWLLNDLTNLKSEVDKELLFVARDIPVYFIAKYPDLALFKIYVWKDIMKQTAVSYEKFAKNIRKSNIETVFDKIYNAQMFIPAKEIWDNHTIDITLRLIKYYHETEAFENKNSAPLLLEQVAYLVDTVRQYAEDGYKESETKTPYSLYISSIDLDNTFMLTRAGNKLACTLRLNSINSITTDNEFMCERQKQLFEFLLHKSVAVSGTSDKERLRFFRAAMKKIDAVREKIK